VTMKLGQLDENMVNGWDLHCSHSLHVLKRWTLCWWNLCFV